MILYLCYDNSTFPTSPHCCLKDTHWSDKWIVAGRTARGRCWCTTALLQHRTALKQYVLYVPLEKRGCLFLDKLFPDIVHSGEIWLQSSSIQILYISSLFCVYTTPQRQTSVSRGCEGRREIKIGSDVLTCRAFYVFWVAVQTQGGFVRTAGTSPDHRTAASIKNRTLNGSVVFQQRQQTCLFQHEGRSRRLKRLFLYMSFIRCKYLWERYISMYEAFFFLESSLSCLTVQVTNLLHL